MGEAQKCIDDCSLGLNIIDREEQVLKDEIKQDDGLGDTRRKFKTKFLARRGAAYANYLKQTTLGVQDYEKALGLDPSNEGLITDLESLKSQMAPAAET